MGPRNLAVPFFATQLVPRFALLATLKKTLVGMAGAKSSSGELLSIRFLPWIRTYRHRALRSFIIGAPFYFEVRDSNVLTLSSLSVSPPLRGKGIGTAMVNEFLRVGKKKGFRAVHLEVINTNVRAKDLYERLGFEVVNFRPVPPPWDRWLGFTGKFDMEYTLDS
jgi:ribosomal protein S18 acetylase RimI-like enzyme